MVEVMRGYRLPGCLFNEILISFFFFLFRLRLRLSLALCVEINFRGSGFVFESVICSHKTQPINRFLGESVSQFCVDKSESGKISLTRS